MTVKITTDVLHKSEHQYVITELVITQCSVKIVSSSLVQSQCKPTVPTTQVPTHIPYRKITVWYTQS